MKKIKLGIVGSTGLVGSVLLEILEKSNFDIGELRLFASEKSKGKFITFKNQKYQIETIDDHSFESLDYVFFCTSASVSKKYVPLALKSKCIVIDNSSFFRMNNDVPLIVPEINLEDIKNSKLISNPNCSTIQSLVALKPIYDLFGINKIIYSTYQAVSGAGVKGIKDYYSSLLNQKNHFFPYLITESLIPEIDNPLDNNFTKEEVKMVEETKKILKDNDIDINATCVRVPLLRTHAVSIYLETSKELDLNLLKSKYLENKSIILLDDLKNHIYPVGEKALNNDLVYIGRIRKSLNNPKGLLLYVVSDNLRKGAASNMVQILEYLVKNNRGII